MALQTVPKPHTEHCVVVTTTAFDINAVESRMFKETRQMAFAAHDVIDALPLQPFHVIVTNFSANAMRLPEDVVVAYSTGTTTSMMTASSTPPRHSPMGTLESVDPIENSDVHPAPCKARLIVGHGEVNPAKETTINKQHTLASAVHYKSIINREA